MSRTARHGKKQPPLRESSRRGEEASVDEPGQKHADYPKIEQSTPTIFRMRNTEWNNVPRVLYDAMGVIVNAVDRHLVEYKVKNTDMYGLFQQ